MLRLIVAHRHDRGLVDQNIRGHQHRILQQPVADRFLRLRLRFVLRHPFQPAHRRHAGQHPREFGVLRHRRLHHDGRVLRIDARRQEQRRRFQDLRAQLGRLLIHRDGVQIDDAEDALVVALDLDPILQRTQIVSNMQIAGRLNAGEDACFHV